MKSGAAICVRCGEPILPTERGTSATTTSIGAATPVLSIAAVTARPPVVELPRGTPSSGRDGGSTIHRRGRPAATRSTSGTGSGRRSRRADRALPSRTSATLARRRGQESGVSPTPGCNNETLRRFVRERAFGPRGGRQRHGRATRNGFPRDAVDRLRRERERQLRERDQVAVDVKRVDVDVRERVAGEVVARVELLTGRAAPDRGLLCGLDSSAPVNRPPDGMPASMKAW